MSDAMIGKEVAKDAVACPYCDSTNTEFFSLFGQQLLTIQYYCNNCRTPFEYVKDEDMPEASAIARIDSVPGLDNQQAFHRKETSA